MSRGELYSTAGGTAALATSVAEALIAANVPGLATAPIGLSGFAEGSEGQLQFTGIGAASHLLTGTVSLSTTDLVAATLIVTLRKDGIAIPGAVARRSIWSGIGIISVAVSAISLLDPLDILELWAEVDEARSVVVADLSISAVSVDAIPVAAGSFAPGPWLTTLVDLKEELGITTSTDDAKMGRWIREATAAVQAFVGQHFARAQVTDTFLRRFETPAYIVDREPLLRLISAAFAGAAVSDVVALPPRKMLREIGFTADPTRPWQIIYRAGYLVRGQDIEGLTGISAVAGDHSFNDAKGRLPLLEAGEPFETAGFDAAALNGRFVAESASTAAKIVVQGSLVDEAGDNSVSLRFASCPQDLARAALDLASLLRGRRGGQSVGSSFRIGPFEQSGGAAASSLLPTAEIERMLLPWRRVA